MFATPPSKPIYVTYQTTLTSSSYKKLSSWRNWSYTPVCAPGPKCRTGVTTLLKKTLPAPLETKTLHDGHILYTKIVQNNSILHLYNLLIPQSDSEALRAIQTLFLHTQHISSDGVIVIGGILIERKTLL